MAESDWTGLTGGALDSTNVKQGVSAAFTLPHVSCGSYCHVMHALNSSGGAAGKFYDVANFNPITAGASCQRGGSIRAVLKKVTSVAGYSPFIGLVDGTDPSSAEGYILGLTEETDYKIALKKGTLGTVLEAGSTSNLRESTTSYDDVGNNADGHFHLRLDVAINPHGEIILDVRMNDVKTNGVLAPTWATVPGMGQFVDDSVGALTGSVPTLGPHYFVYGMRVSNASGAVALFDHIECIRQTSP